MASANRQLSAVILRRQFVHSLEEGCRVGGVDFRGDAMAEVEHVTAAGTIGGQNARHLGTNRCLSLIHI